MRLSRLLAEASTSGPAAVPAPVVRGLGGDGIDARAASSVHDPVVSSLAQSHARVEPGALFIARRGASFDGHDMIPAAIAAGAVAVVGERLYSGVGDVPYIAVPDARLALPHLAAAFHQHPSRALAVVGVTGTDGKTTTSFLLHWLLAERFEAGLISTAGVRLGQTVLATDGHFTTPEATEVQSLLARFVAAGVSHAVLESSSHGFSQHRLDAVEYHLGVFTNLSSEHLDHHKTWENYREAKATLMRRAERSIINLDDAEAPYFEQAARDARDAARVPRLAGPFGKGAVIGYGTDPKAAVRIESVAAAEAALDLTFDVAGRRLKTSLPMIGSYNAYNAAAAVAAAVELGLEPAAAMARLEGFPGVPGRMQVVQREPFLVVVDFAHTPPALDKVLREVARQGRRSVVVIGAAGERDPGKREALGRVATALADLAIFTEEDSRSEPIDEILASMAAGAQTAGAVNGRDFLVIPDRREAIAAALDDAGAGDVVILAGKGHETTLERLTETVPWDEVAEVERALRRP